MPKAQSWVLTSCLRCPHHHTPSKGQGGQGSVRQLHCCRLQKGETQVDVSPQTRSLIDVPVPASPPQAPDDIYTGCCMEPVSGPGQCSLHRPWVLPGWGQEDADSWEPSGLVTRSLEFFTPPPPCEHTQPCPCVQRYSHLCRDVEPNACARCIVCVHMYHQRAPQGIAAIVQNPALALPPQPQFGGLEEQDWPEGYSTHPPHLGSAS